MTAVEALDALSLREPEWAPWLAVVRVAVGEAGNAAWAAMVPHAAQRQPGVPLLAGVDVHADLHALAHFFERLTVEASAGALPVLAELAAVSCSGADAGSLFEGSLNGDADAIAALADRSGVAVDPLHAVAGLLPLPFLQACNIGWGAAAVNGWSEGYCPVCGVWPAFAEVRGVERSRHLRCGRCGSAWEVPPLWCLRCGSKDHDALGSLVVEEPGSSATIDVCKGCRAYVKVFKRLQGCPPAQVLVDDLASADLDLAAGARDYQRPHGAAYALAVAVRASVV